MKLGALSPKTLPDDGSTTAVPDAAQRDGEKSSALCASGKTTRLGAFSGDVGEFQLLLPLLLLQLGKKGMAGAGDQYERIDEA